MDIGAPELLIVLVIALLLFGNRLPQIARSLGQAQRELKRGMAEGVPRGEGGGGRSDDGNV